MSKQTRLPQWQISRTNYAVGPTRVMLEFSKPGAVQVRSEHRDSQSVIATFAAEFKKSPHWLRYWNLYARFVQANDELKLARENQAAAEGQYTAAIADGTANEITESRQVMERYQQSSSNLAAEIEALRPAVAEAYKTCCDLFNTEWRDVEVERHRTAKATLGAVLEKIEAAVAPLIAELQTATEAPASKSTAAILNPSTALGAPPKLVGDESEPTAIPIMGQGHQPAHPLAFA